MSRFVKPEIERMDLGGGDWVDLRLRLAYGARRGIEGKLLGPLAVKYADRGPDDPEPTGALDIEAGNVELLLRAIVAWGGPGFCSLIDHDAGGSHEGACAPQPITAENIAQLDETGDRVLNWLQPRLAKATPDFSKPPSQSSRTTRRAGRTKKGSPTSS